MNVEEYEYVRKGLVEHLRAAGLSNQEIVLKLFEIARPSVRVFCLIQFFESLPMNQREQYLNVLSAN